MSLSSAFIERPVATTLLNVSIVIAGAVAATLLPVSPLPQVDLPTIQVTAALPGASPETMASSVATPLERALGTIAGVNEISSRSSQGSTRISVQFDLGKDINVAAREVHHEVARVGVEEGGHARGIGGPIGHEEAGLARGVPGRGAAGHAHEHPGLGQAARVGEVQDGHARAREGRS